ARAAMTRSLKIRASKRLSVPALCFKAGIGLRSLRYTVFIRGTVGWLSTTDESIAELPEYSRDGSVMSVEVIASQIADGSVWPVADCIATYPRVTPPIKARPCDSQS